MTINTRTNIKLIIYSLIKKKIMENTFDILDSANNSLKETGDNITSINATLSKYSENQAETTSALEKIISGMKKIIAPLKRRNDYYSSIKAK